MKMKILPADGMIELDTRHRLLLPRSTGNTYRNVNNPNESGGSPLHDELDDYLDEKGVDFDIGLIETVHLVRITNGVQTERHLDARVWVLNVLPDMMQDVIIPGILHIAHNHRCTVTEMHHHMTPSRLATKGIMCSKILEVRH